MELLERDRKLINGFLRIKGYSNQTARQYRLHLERLHRWLTSKNLNFREMSLDNFLDYLDDQEKWGASQRIQALTAAKALARYRWGDDHIITKFNIKRPPPKPQRTLSLSEVTKLLKSFNLETMRGVRNYALILLLLDTGLRSTEVCRLTLDDIDLEKLTLTVQVKGGRWRTAAFTEHTANALHNWLSIRSKKAPPNVSAFFVGVCGSTPGQQMTKSGLRSNCRRMAKKAEIKHFSPHALRRTMATIMTAENSAPTRVTQISGGWLDIRQVEHYTRSLTIEVTRPYLATRAIFGSQSDSTQALSD